MTYSWTDTAIRKRWAKLNRLSAGHRIKGLTQSEDENETVALIDIVAIGAEVYSAVSQLH